MRILAIDPGSRLGWATDATGRLEWGTEDFRIRNGESSGNRWRRFGEWLESVAGMDLESPPKHVELPPPLKGPTGAGIMPGHVVELRSDSYFIEGDNIVWTGDRFIPSNKIEAAFLPGESRMIWGTALGNAKPGEHFLMEFNPHFRRQRFVPRIDLVVYERAHFMPKARAAAEIAAGFTTRLEEHCERHGIALEPVAVQTLKAYAIPAVRRKKGDSRLDRSKVEIMRRAGHRLWELEHGDDNGMTVLTEHEADALWLYWMAKERWG